MYADLSGPLHKMLQVGKFNGRKGSKKKLAWTTEVEEAFDKSKEQLLGQLGLFLVDPDKGFVLRTDATDYAVGAVLEQVRCHGRHGSGNFLESGPWGRPTSDVDREGEGDLYHCVRAPEMVGPHQTSSRGGMYRSSITSELAQGACGYSLGSSGKGSPMARDFCKVRLKCRLCPREGQHCSR